MGTRNIYVVEKTGANGPEFVDLVETISPARAISFCTQPVYTARMVTARELANLLLAHDKVEIKQDKRREGTGSRRNRIVVLVSHGGGSSYLSVPNGPPLFFP